MTRETLHHLVDELPETQIAAAAQMLELLKNEPDTAWDDPEYCAYVVEKIRIADEQIARGETMSLQEARERLLG